MFHDLPPISPYASGHNQVALSSLLLSVGSHDQSTMFFCGVSMPMFVSRLDMEQSVPEVIAHGFAKTALRVQSLYGKVLLTGF